MNPLISIIIPYYNSEKYIERCIKSVVSQSYQNLEVLLVNDGSPDGSEEIVHRLSADDPRIKNITVPHGGVSMARNEGLSAASGEYIMFIDSDDWIGKDIIEHMMTLMQDTGVDLVTCDLERTTYQSKHHAHQPLKYEVCTREEYLRLFFKIETNEWVHFPVAKLYKKDLLPHPLYPPNIRVGEDVYGSYLALAKTEKIVRLREIGYYYFTNPDSATSSFTEKDFDLLKVWDQVVEVTEGIEPDHTYAQLNRDRTNFTLLFRMHTELSAKEIRENYDSQRKQLLADLRKCEKNLLHSPIVPSRKILIFLMCHFYPLASFVGSIIYKTTGSGKRISQRRLS